MWRRRSRRRSHGGRPYRIEGCPEAGAWRIPLPVSPYHAGALYGHPGARPVSDAALVGDGRERSDASTRPVRAEGLDRACAPEKNGVQAEGQRVKKKKKKRAATAQDRCQATRGSHNVDTDVGEVSVVDLTGGGGGP